MIEDLVSKIKTIPPLPKSYQEVDKIYKSENANVNDMAKAISKDPMFVANLLKMANSPLYSLRSEVQSVLQAVSLFGMTTTRDLCLSVSVKKLLNLDIEPYGVTSEEFGEITNLQGALASTWYATIDPGKKDFLFLCALLQEVGKIVIADEIVTNNETVQFKSEVSSAVHIEQVEKSFVGAITAEVTSAIFEHWRLDEIMVKTIKESANPLKLEEKNPEAMALFIIRKAASIVSPFSEKSMTTARAIIEKSDFELEPFEAAAASVQAKQEQQ